MDGADGADGRGSRGERELQAELGTGSRADRFYRTQVLDHLNAEMQDLVGRQEMMFVATADAAGESDCTFRAGPRGFVWVLDGQRLAYPEYRGNGVMASLGNMRENPHVGLLFVDFFEDVIGLHVNGRAGLVARDVLQSDEPGLPVDDHPGRRTELWVLVTVEEAYIHCSKHIPLLARLTKQRHWGTDDHKRKGGDFFRPASCRTDVAAGPGPDVV